MVIIEIEAASCRIVAVIKKRYEFPHGLFHTFYILFDKFRQGGSLEPELVCHRLHPEHVFIYNRHEKVQLYRIIVHQPGFRQPAGFSDLYLTCLLIIHLGENAQCVFKHFFTVGYHDKIKLIDIYLPKIGHYLEIQVRNAEESSIFR